MNSQSAPTVFPPKEIEGVMHSNAVVDMRYITGICVIRDMNVPWTAELHYTLNDLGIFDFRATWTIEEGEEPSTNFSTQAIVILNTNGHHIAPNNLTLNRVLGDFDFDGRHYVVCTANLDTEFTFLSILKPTWRGGNFAFLGKMKLPASENFISAYSTLLIEDNQDVSQTRFAVYMSFDTCDTVVDSIVSVEPITNDFSIYDVEIRPADEEQSVRPFTINGLKMCIAKQLADDIDTDDEEM